jgi:putative flippase GtrA
MTANSWRSIATRWLKFNLVGGIGIVVQLLMLVVLKTGLHLHYLVATALAVETAVVHNFLWHERFTWADRAGPSFVRFCKFNLTTGLFSIAGNLVMMRLLVGLGHFNYLLANGITITVCSVINFLVSDGFVFAAAPPARRHLTIDVINDTR